MNTRVIATAGHVDHGKSTLIQQLTGTDPDRFPEEKSRGLTIDLGFAFARLGEFEVGFVDVPGHTRFIKNMLAGVGAVEVALLVVAANEGVMAQTIEHVEILDLFGIQHGVIALTKAALVDAETLELAELELHDALAGTAMAMWPIVAVDAPTGRGLSTLVDLLTLALRKAPAPQDRHRARVWVDRSFAAKGAGTVVTGTLTMGSLHIDDEVSIEPGARSARIRSIQSGHDRVSTATPGTRVALNLVGVNHEDVRRGDAVVTPGAWAITNAVDVELVGSHNDLPTNAALSVHVGSGEHSARWHRHDGPLPRGRLRFTEPLALQPGDRLVLRSTARRSILSGAVVISVVAQRASRLHSNPADLDPILAVAQSEPWLSEQQIVQRTGLDPTLTNEQLVRFQELNKLHCIDDCFIGSAALTTLLDSIQAAVVTHHDEFPDDPGIAIARLSAELALDHRKIRGVLALATDLVVDHEVVRSAQHIGRASESPDGIRFLGLLRAKPFAPPAPQDVDVPLKIVKLLVREGVVQQHGDLYFATEAIVEAQHIVSAAVRDAGSLTVAQIRDLLGTTRKYVLPMVTALDALGVTRRRGDDRIPGPRA